MNVEFITKLKNGDQLVKNADGELFVLHPLNINFNIPHSIEPSKKDIIASTLVELGIPQFLSGFDRLVHIILIVIESPNVPKLASEIYPQLSKEENIGVAQIDSSIRHAIDHCDRNSPSFLRIFNTNEHIKPKDFIVTLAKSLK